MANKVEIIINADGSRAIKALKDVGATAAATGKANADAAKLSQEAAKFEGDTISAASVKVVKAREQQRLASAEYAKIQALIRKGSLDEATATTTAAAAYQRLTAAKLAAVRASAAHMATMEGEARGFARIRETLGAGVSATGAFASSIPGLAAFASAAGALGELKSAVTETLEFGEAMQRASEKTGLAVGTLSVLHYAAATTGGDFDSMTSAVAKMDKTIGLATEGNKRAEAFMRALGLNATELAGRSDGAEVAFQKFATTLAATENPIRRVELATALLGKAGSEQIPMLIQLGTQWDELTQKTKDAGRYLTELDAQQLEETNQKLKALGEHIDGAKVSIAEGFTPALGQMIDVIESGKGPLDGMRELGEDLGRTFAFVGEVLYSAAAAAEVFFAATERAAALEAKLSLVTTFTGLSSNLSKTAGTDEAAFNRLLDKANQMHDIAFGEAPTDHSGRVVHGAGTTGAPVGMDATATPSGTGTRKRAGDGEGFAGVGDLSGGDPERKRFEAMKDALEEQKMFHGASLDDEESYWQKMLATAKAKSELYTLIVPEVEKAQQAVIGAYARASLQAAEISQRLNQEIHDSLQKTWEDLNKSDEATAKASYAAQSDIVTGVADKRLQDLLGADQVRSMQLQGMGAGYAAHATASMHTQEYQERRGDLNSAMTRASSAPGDTPADIEARSRQIEAIQKQTDALERERQLQVAEDDKRIESTTILGGLNDAMREFIQTTTDAGAMMKSIFSAGLNDTNSAIVKMLTEPASQTRGQHVFGQAGHEIFTSATGTLLKGAEGSVMKGLGLGGKHDGSSESNPLWVRMVREAEKFESSVAKTLHLPGVIPFNGSSGSGSSGGGLEGMLSHLFGGGKSSGDDSSMMDSDMAEATAGTGIMSKLASAGSWIENLVHFDEGTNYVPHDMLAVVHQGEAVVPKAYNQGGGAGGHTFHMPISVDARGATDPAAVEEAGYRGAMRAAPQIHQAVLNSVKQQKDRRPTH